MKQVIIDHLDIDDKQELEETLYNISDYGIEAGCCNFIYTKGIYRFFEKNYEVVIETCNDYGFFEKNYEAITSMVYFAVNYTELI